MKLIYRKPLIFPLWAIFKNKDAGKKFYDMTEDGVSFSCDNSLLPHFNHVEMTGFQASSIISYKIGKNKQLKLHIFCVYPQIRVIPNETRGGLTYKFNNVEVNVNNEAKTCEKIFFNGILTVYEQAGSVEIIHRFCTARDKKALIEKIEIINTSDKTQFVTVKNKKPEHRINKIYLVENSNQTLYTSVYLDGVSMPDKQLNIKLAKGKRKILTAVYGIDRLSQIQAQEQIEKREDFISQLDSRLKITTPDAQINQMLHFCKIRASESIFETKNGLMHAPGGGNFYGALWTNDQCEYANPLFAYMGYEPGIAQSINCYRLYSDFAASDKAIPTSIIACGDRIWNGAGDRGDSSMYLYGLSRFLLSRGDEQLAQSFVEPIVKASEYVISNITEDGIVKSDSDELENRFESGSANLSTSVITYDAFISLSYLFKSLNNEQKAKKYLFFAEKIKDGIENYFGAQVEGFHTYRYCKEESRLRSWICLPLTVGIDERKTGTVNALLSDKLNKNSALLTRSGEKTYWDRSALYAMRGLFYCGEAQRAYKMLTQYTAERLLGCHPPYPVEAFPEGNSAQLSAESALYLRIFTEGILGYRPTGFSSFEIKPNLPDKWDHIDFENIELLGKPLNISVKNGKHYTVIINGEKIEIVKGEKYVYKTDDIKN
ncbi:MAG: hypothetical protein ACI4W6_01005 [Acutalibacteraceae bacterium]